jgi:hypothetical protein
MDAVDEVGRLANARGAWPVVLGLLIVVWLVGCACQNTIGVMCILGELLL